MSGKSSQKETALSLIKQWSKSGKSVQGFCKENNFSHHTFRYWLKRTEKNKLSPFVSDNFIPVEIKNTQLNPVEKIIELHYPNGVRIRLSSGTELSLLRMLIQLY